MPTWHRRQTRVAAIVAAIALFGALACDIAVGHDALVTEEVNNSFTVGPSPTLDVETENGKIDVRVGPDSEIIVEASIRGLDKLDYSAHQDGDTVTVLARRKERTSVFSFGNSPGADLTITVPASPRFNLRTSNGRIDLVGVRESGTLSSSNGAIVISDVLGDIAANTSNGRIEIGAY